MQNLIFVAQSLVNRRVTRLSASLLLAATLAVLTGCGSGGAGGSPADAAAAAAAASSTTTPTPVVASLQLLAGSTTIPSSGATLVDLTAIVLSSTKQTISGKTVIFSTGSDSTAFINNVSASGVSDANGLVTAKLNLGGSKSIRTITVSATADSATATNTVDVTGTTLTVSGSTSLAFGASTTLTFSVKDSAGNAMQNVTVSLASKSGNTIALSPATGITDSSGQITATVTATAAGNDTLSATAAGATATQDLIVSSASFTLKATNANPACAAGIAKTPPEIPLAPDACSAPTMSVNWTDAGVPQAGKAVSFVASRGAIAGSPSTTNAAGDTSGVTISSAVSAGPSIITASGPGGTPAATLAVVFVATSATSATVQAIPGTVQVSTGSASQSNNIATIRVVVRDAANNLVKNAGVSFSITSDPSGGSLISSTGITDVSGTASVTYRAGGVSSAQNGVTITATISTVNGVAIAAVTGTTNLTVSGQSLLVRLGTDNKISTTPLPQNANVKTYVAIVTDAAGNPVVGTTVNFTLRPGHYDKGTWIADPSNTHWIQNIKVTCNNEDLNFNGILDPGEGLVTWPAGVTPALLPGIVASVNATAVTDSGGIAVATLTYAKNFSLWTEITLEARTSVTSNDPPTQNTFYLPGDASDYTPLTTAPPPIPWGSDNTCADTL